MKPSEAKKIILQKMEELGLNCSGMRIRAKTVSFMDLARGDCVFVTIQDFYNMNPGKYSEFEELEKLARKNGFRVNLH